MDIRFTMQEERLHTEEKGAEKWFVKKINKLDSKIDAIENRPEAKIDNQ